MKPKDQHFREDIGSIIGMEYVLVDIKNFLKKLENGQLEIEAGQWELQKTLLNMSKVVADLKNLKDDVEDMRVNNIQQMGLIKELQLQLAKLQKIGLKEPMTVSESSVEYERAFKRPAEGQAASKGFKKRKCRIRSEEIIEITSQVSVDKTESESGSAPTIDICPKDNNRKNFTATTNEQVSDEASQDAYQSESYMNQAQATSQYTPTSTDMLQRYLKDSVKYVDRPDSKSTEPTQHSSRGSECERSNSVEYAPFWDDYSSRVPSECHSENRNTKTAKENPSGSENGAGENILPKKFPCPKCPKKFLCKADSIRHEKKHRESESLFYCKDCGKGFGSKEKLKDHEQVHRITKSFKGFRCSYCGKLCSSPEKLTAHLRKCRIIMKAHSKNK